MTESPAVQKFCEDATGAVPTLTVVLADGADPAPFAATTEYVVLCGGATLTLQAVPPMPPDHEHDVTGLPVPQVAVSVTVWPAVIGAIRVLGFCAIEQLPGGVGAVEPWILTVVLNAAPTPEGFEGVTVYVVVVDGATWIEEPITPMLQL